MVCPVSSGTAGREARLHDCAVTGWVGADVQAALLESLQCLAVAKREHRIQVCAFLHFGKVQHAIDQARAAARGDVPGLGAQRRPGGSARSWGGDLGCGDSALIVADLDVLMPFRPGKPEVLVIRSQGVLKRARPAKPLKPRRDLGVIQVRVIAAARADELEHVCVAAPGTAIRDADRLASQDRRAAVAGLPGGRERAGAGGLGARPRVTAITGARYGHGGRTGSRSGTGHDVRHAGTNH